MGKEFDRDFEHKAKEGMQKTPPGVLEWIEHHFAGNLHVISGRVETIRHFLEHVKTVRIIDRGMIKAAEAALQNMEERLEHMRKDLNVIREGTHEKADEREDLPETGQ